VIWACGGGLQLLVIVVDVNHLVIDDHVYVLVYLDVEALLLLALLLLIILELFDALGHLLLVDILRRGRETGPGTCPIIRGLHDAGVCHADPELGEKALDERVLNL